MVIFSLSGLILLTLQFELVVKIIRFKMVTNMV